MVLVHMFSNKAIVKRELYTTICLRFTQPGKVMLPKPKFRCVGEHENQCTLLSESDRALSKAVSIFENGVVIVFHINFQLSAICNCIVVSAIWGHQPRSRVVRLNPATRNPYTYTFFFFY